MPPDAEAGWRPSFLVLTCEHAGRDVPPEFRRLFRGVSEVLRSHRGYDIGALGVAQVLASGLAAPLLFTTVTRLLVEANRSIGHPQLFSSYTRHLPEEVHEELIRRFHAPHRAAVTATLEALVGAGHRVLHLAVHSFTDELDGERRELDVGLLFDPERHSERGVCATWQHRLAQDHPDLRVRFNEPYLGIDDGLTTSMRTQLPVDSYAGVELELRQGLIEQRSRQVAMARMLLPTLASLVAPPGGRPPRLHG